MEPVLLIHGGAGRLAVPERRATVAGALQAIAGEVYGLLGGGASALDAVVEATRRLEDDPLFNAGTGAKLQADGAARLSASLADGARERFSGVINVEGLANPIALCSHLLDESDRVLAAEGALARARALGLPEKDVRTEHALQAWREAVEGRHGTVGAVALDRDGRLAAASSTGGRGMERIGRVSDSATVAGNYADRSAAVTCTGIGEDIVDGALAARLVGAVGLGTDLRAAAAALLGHMQARGWRAGFLGLDTHGRWVAEHTTEALYWWSVTPEGSRGFVG